MLDFMFAAMDQCATDDHSWPNGFEPFMPRIFLVKPNPNPRDCRNPLPYALPISI